MRRNPQVVKAPSNAGTLQSQVEKIETPNLDRFESGLRSRVEVQNRALEKFKKNLEQNPLHAFQWSDSAFYASAFIHVANYWLGSIETWRATAAAGTFAEGQPRTDSEVIEFIRKILTREVTRRAGQTENSSSTPANMCARYETKAYAEILEGLDNFW